MAAILAIISAGALSGYTNDAIFDEVDDHTELTFAPTVYASEVDRLNGAYSAYRISTEAKWPIIAEVEKSFFQDYYFRIHVSPAAIAMQTIASSQSRDIKVWNSWPYTTSQIDTINISGSDGISISGQAVPYAMPPLLELTYSVTLDPKGSPVINNLVLFDFIGIADPYPVTITGLRAVKFAIVPEIPVKETWEWMSDKIVSVDGTEQRLALRGEMPRVELTVKAILDTNALINVFYAELLNYGGRLWIPEYQYATAITAASVIGALQITYDNTKTDIRDDEYILIKTSTETYLLGVDVINATGALLASPLTVAIPKDALVMPGSPGLIDDHTSYGRYSVNTVAETTIPVRLMRQRASLSRQGIITTPTLFLGTPVLDKRPMADGLVRDQVSTGLVTFDNDTGLEAVMTRWDYARIGGPRKFLVDRMKTPADMDYWKMILGYCRGQSRKVWMPTYRTDLVLAASPLDSATSYLITGTQYAEKAYPVPTHRYIEIETSSGTVRASVTGATVVGVNSQISFSPAIPAGAGYMTVTRISYLLPVRLSSDKAEWDHLGLHSTLKISVVTAEV